MSIIGLTEEGFYMKEVIVKFPSGKIKTFKYATEISKVLKQSKQLEGCEFPVVAAFVNNELVSLNTRIKIDAEIIPVYLNSYEGARIYRKTLTVLLSKVCSELFPGRTLVVGHSLSTGYYCYFEGYKNVKKSEICSIARELKKQVERGYKD